MIDAVFDATDQSPKREKMSTHHRSKDRKLDRSAFRIRKGWGKRWGCKSYPGDHPPRELRRSW